MGVTRFSPGDRVIHTFGYRGDAYKALGTVLGIGPGWGCYFVVTDEIHPIFGREFHTYLGKNCYLLSEGFMTLAGPPLSQEEKVILRIKKLWNESKYVQSHPESAYSS